MNDTLKALVLAGLARRRNAARAEAHAQALDPEQDALFGRDAASPRDAAALSGLDAAALALVEAGNRNAAGAEQSVHTGAGQSASEVGQGAHPGAARTEQGVSAEPGEPVKPESWSEELWLALAPEVRAEVHALVCGHRATLDSEIRARVDGERESCRRREAVSDALRHSLDLLGRVVRHDLDHTDWDALARRDPGLWVRLRQQLDARMNAVAALEQRWLDERRDEERCRRDALLRELSAEADAFRAEFDALMGEGCDRESCKADLCCYLLEQGVPLHALENISRAYEVRMALKAMLYDRMNDCRVSAAAKLDEAPCLQEPRAACAVGGRLHSARERLNQNPNSTDALAALFAAI